MIGQTVFYQRQKKPPIAKLSLVALMDIFTILVFFLLLNSGDSKNIEQAEFVKLPNSSSGKAPHADLLVVVGEDQLWVGKEAIGSVEPIKQHPDKLIEPLKKALVEHKEKMGELTAFEKNNGLSLTILGHKNVPYNVVRSVMSTCRSQGFRNISLAVNRVAADIQQGTQLAAPTLAASFGAKQRGAEE